MDADGDNCILLYPGANRQITPADAERVLEGFGAGDLLMLQNEISSLDEIIEKAYRRGLRIALNPVGRWMTRCCTAPRCRWWTG